MTAHLSGGPACRLILTAALAATLGACAGSTAPSVKPSQRGMPQDIGGVREEEKFREVEVTLPAYPQDSGLVEFQPRRNSRNTYYIDRNSLSIGPDRVVRFSAVVKSPSGARNTSYEGMRCKTSEYRIYALGIKGAEWAETRDSQWREIAREDGNFRFTLFKDYFCASEAIAGRSEQDLLANLKGNLLGNAGDRNR
jgi:hypothetical protein